jgi:hypothetical protein
MLIHLSHTQFIVYELFVSPRMVHCFNHITSKINMNIASHQSQVNYTFYVEKILITHNQSY